MISPQDFETLRQILHSTSGHSLGKGKEYLVERRLEPVAQSLSFPDIGAMIRHMGTTRDKRVTKLVCEAMTTNESLFFRDGKPFELLKSRLIPELLRSRANSRRIRIWSAAASTGQEAYSIAMTLADSFPQLASWQVEIVGTDYSPQVVERARKGEFNHFEVQRGLPIMTLMKHFVQDGEVWRVRDELKRSIRFQEGNLLEPFTHLGTFDLVFCRNVLIYFDAETKKGVLDRIARVMAPDGYLFLGASETVFGITDQLQSVEGANTTLYERRDAERQKIPA
jgi:chemotaxis protein methyltransferase CheR